MILLSTGREYTKVFDFAVSVVRQFELDQAFREGRLWLIRG